MGREQGMGLIAQRQKARKSKAPAHADKYQKADARRGGAGRNEAKIAEERYALGFSNKLPGGGKMASTGPKAKPKSKPSVGGGKASKPSTKTKPKLGTDDKKAARTSAFRYKGKKRALKGVDDRKADRTKGLNKAQGSATDAKAKATNSSRRKAAGPKTRGKVTGAGYKPATKKKKNTTGAATRKAVRAGTKGTKMQTTKRSNKGGASGRRANRKINFSGK